MTTAVKGKVALVTGSGRRIGRALAEALGRAGARVAIHYNESAEHAAEAAAALNASRADAARTFQADLLDAAAAEALPGRVADEMGALDIVVNNASIMLRQPFGEVTPEAWDEVHHVNLRACFFVAQGAAPYLRAAHGSLVNISDLSAFEAWPGYLPHSASKAGVESLTRGLARVMAPEVRVNAIAPGAVLLPDDWGESESAEIIRTTPLKRLGSPEDVVRAMMYLLESQYTTGVTIVVDGGRRLAPQSP